jgi:DNA polymerase-3 subunit alpha
VQHIRFGLKALRGAGEKAVEAIMRERERAGPFQSLHDFCERVPQQSINKAVLEALIKCGAFDSLHGRDQRAAMIASVDQAISAGSRLAADRATGQSALFGGPSVASGAPDARRLAPPNGSAHMAPLARVNPWSETETLAREKEALGFYVSSHPLERWKFWSSVFANSDTQRIKELPKDTRVVFAAMVQSARTLLVKTGRSAGQKMAIVTMEDMLGACECVLFTECFARYGHLATGENVVFVLGRVDTSRGEAQVVVDKLVPVDGVPLESGRLRLFLDATKLNGEGPGTIARVGELLRAKGERAKSVTSNGKASEASQSPCPVDLVIATEDSVALLQVDPKVRVLIEPGIVQELQGELGVGMLRVVGGMSVEKERERRPWRNGRKDDTRRE